MNNTAQKLSKKGITQKKLNDRDFLLSWTTDEKKKNAMSCYEVMVHKLCQERCLFCSQDHESRTTEIKPDDYDIYRRILHWIKNWYWMLWFTGWEPLIHPNIFKYIRFWKKAGFKLIRVQTNWVMLWKPWFAKMCVESWVTLFKLSIHHYKPEVHDKLVWLNGALDKCIYWIKELNKLWARTGINIVLTEQNYRDLPDFLLYFLNLWVKSFVIIYPLYEESMAKEVDTVGFKFTKTIPYLVKSLQIFDKIWLSRPLVLNLPMCLLPWYQDSIIQTFNGTAVLNLDGSQTNIDDNKAGWKKRVKICGSCEHNKICFWVDEKYLNYWWEEEFNKFPENITDTFDLEKVNIKEYFSDDELCFFELLTKKKNLTIEDIFELKDNIQICKDCDSLNKIITTWEILLKKWLISKQMEKWKIIYNII